MWPFSNKAKGKKVKVEITGYQDGKMVELFDKKDDSPIHSYAYYSAIQNKIRPLEDVMVNLASALKEQKLVDDRIAILKALISSYYDLKSMCISMGPDYRDYFFEMWENIHNTKTESHSYISRYEEELNRLTENRDKLKAKESLRAHACEDLDKKLIQFLKTSGPVLQTDIYTMFDPEAKEEISTLLYYMAKRNEIRRTKNGRTYLIEFLSK